MRLTEDDLYRLSTQYTHWSFTPSQLAAQRLSTNIKAAEHVKAAVARRRAARTLQSSENTSASETGADTPNNGSSTPLPTNATEVQCLTVGEEKILLDTFCERALKLGDFLKLPIEVSATCVQFLRRFYLLNSPMTYDPQTISRTVMFIANKVEDHGLRIDQYANSLPKTTEADILAPEFLITQGIRFDYEVRHPFRGLKGGHLELIEMAKGNAALPPSANGQTPQELQKTMLSLPRRPGGTKTDLSVKQLEERITYAYGFASKLLKSAALLTDAYFLYTPSHIWLSAHLLADEPLTLLYLSTKIPPSHPTHVKLHKTLRECGTLLSSHRTSPTNPQSHLPPEEKIAQEKKEKEEISRLLKKLKQCRDPDKMDLTKVAEAKEREKLKRDAAKAAAREPSGEGGVAGVDGAEDKDLDDERSRKRRKIEEREGFQKEADSFWGPALKKEGGEGGEGGNRAETLPSGDTKPDVRPLDDPFAESASTMDR